MKSRCCLVETETGKIPAQNVSIDNASGDFVFRCAGFFVTKRQEAVLKEHFAVIARAQPEAI
jgi:hypothetical protein